MYKIIGQHKTKFTKQAFQFSKALQIDFRKPKTAFGKFNIKMKR